tara:strand:+ start:4611 stop:5972 length:1362 start_codon:yes stop_codon:yes gene_type:complete
MSSSIRIIDPVYFNNTRSAEFRLDEENTAYLTSGMYLALGAEGANATVNAVGYNRKAGVASLVSAIRLLDGGTVLAQLENAGMWMAWKGTNHDNADAVSKRAASLASGSLINFHIAEAKTPLIIGHPVTPSIGTLAVDAADVSLGHIAIKDFLKELEVLRVLPTVIFDNLRLQVDFTTDVSTICNKNATGAGAVSALKAVRPILVCDVVKDPATIAAMVSSMSQMSFTGIESDRFLLPEITTGRTTHIQTLRGFNNKVVNRVLIANQPTDPVQGVVQTNTDGGGAVTLEMLSAGKLNSLAQNRYTVNCRVNGASVFPGRGLGYDETYGSTTKVGAGYNHRLGILTDTWGDVSLCQGSNTCGLVCKDLTSGDAINQQVLANDVGQIFFGQDYTGFKVMDRVSHLELSISRSFVATANAPNMNAGTTNQAINQFVYAEVPKTLQIMNGAYRVAYL